jgi:hypothetical protein
MLNKTNKQVATFHVKLSMKIKKCMFQTTIKTKQALLGPVSGKALK